MTIELDEPKFPNSDGLTGENSTNSAEFMEPKSPNSGEIRELNSQDSGKSAIRKALEAYAEIEKVNHERAVAMNATRLQKAVENFRMFFEAEPNGAGLTADGKFAWFFSDGRKILYEFLDRTWSVEGICPSCGLKTLSPGTTSLETLGKYLEHFQPEYDHKDVCVPSTSRSTFPIVSDDVMITAAMAVQTPDQVLLQALKDVIHNEIVEELGR